MAILYKYIEPVIGPGNKPKPILILESLRLIAANPCGFNDPFEVRPWYDQERHDHAERTHNDFHNHFWGREASSGLVGYPAELAADFAEHHHKRFRDEISARFRVLCLSRSASSVLMWSHYTNTHSGIVIGIETSDQDFRTGLKTEGYEVIYEPDRFRIRLPLAYYQRPCVERYDSAGNILNNPNENVVSDAGLLIPFGHYRKQLEDVYMTALTTKAADWHYEDETRFIYDLQKNSKHLNHENGRCFVSVPASALREIIIGFRSDYKLVQEIVKLYKEGRIGSPKLSYSECHPSQYKVLSHDADADYILGYFRHVRPSM